MDQETLSVSDLVFILQANSRLPDGVLEFLDSTKGSSQKRGTNIPKEKHILLLGWVWSNNRCMTALIIFQILLI